MNKLSFDVEAAKEQLTQVFRDKIAAQGSIYNLLNVDLEDISFSDLENKIENQDQLIAEMKKNLANAQSDGEQWFNNVQPNLTVIPQAAINYATQWNQTINLVLEELRKPEPDRQALATLFGGLSNSADEQLKTLSGLVDSLNDVKSSLSKDAENFSNKNQSFKKLEDLDKENLTAARNAIAKIKKVIASLNQEIEIDTIKEERDLAIASNAMKYGKKFGKAGKILGLIIGLIFIVSATMAIDDMIAAINARLAEEEKEGEFELEMTSLTTQLISLDTASNALAAVVEEIDDLIDSLNQTIQGWKSDSEVLTSIIKDLQGTAPVSSILDQFDLGETQAEWDDLNTFATKWQTIEISPKASNDIVINPPKNGQES